MDTFNLIKQFFTRMDCRYCGDNFVADDIHMVGRGEHHFVVAIHCHQCGKHNGDAAVGIEQQVEGLVGQLGAAGAMMGSMDLETLFQELGIIIEDPELTDYDLQRFEGSTPIGHNDVLEAHQFIQNLDSGWSKLIPEDIRQRCTVTDTE